MLIIADGNFFLTPRSRYIPGKWLHQRRNSRAKCATASFTLRPVPAGGIMPLILRWDSWLPQQAVANTFFFAHYYLETFGLWASLKVVIGPLGRWGPEGLK